MRLPPAYPLTTSPDEAAERQHVRRLNGSSVRASSQAPACVPPFAWRHMEREEAEATLRAKGVLR